MLFPNSFSGIWNLGCWERNISRHDSASPLSKLFLTVCLLLQWDFGCLLWGQSKTKKPKTRNKNNQPFSPKRCPSFSRWEIWLIFPLISKNLYGETGIFPLILPNCVKFTCALTWDYLGKLSMLSIWMYYDAFPKTQEIKFG